MTTEIWNPAARGDSHRNCLVCGSRDPLKLGLVFMADGSGVTATFRANEGLQGYSGILHGGVTSALLDAVMTHCLFHNGISGLTASLSVRFLEPVPCGADLVLRARLVRTRPPFFSTASEMLMEGRVLASATARFLLKPGALGGDGPVI